MRWLPAILFPLVLAAAEPRIRFATYLGGGGNEVARAVAADPAGNIFVAGRTDSPDFPVKNAVQPESRAFSQVFIARFTPDGELVAGSEPLTIGRSTTNTMLGVPARGLAVDAEGNRIAVVTAIAADLPVERAIQNNLKGGSDVYLVKLSK